MLETKTTSDRSARRRCGRAARTSWCGPIACTASTHDSSSCVVSATALPRLATPALLTRTSRPPNRSTAVATACSDDAGSSTCASTATAIAPSPASLSTSASADSRSRREVRTTDAPPSASSVLTAPPMPRPPPVTRATRPASGCPADGSATGRLAPRLAGGGARVAGQAQQPLFEDVAEPLGGAALDGVGAAAQEPALDVLAVGPRRGAVRSGRVAAVQARLDPEQVHAELVDVLVELGADELADAALGADLLPALDALPVAGEPGGVGAGEQVDQPVAQRGGAQVGPLAPQVQRRADRAGPADAGPTADS